MSIQLAPDRRWLLGGLILATDALAAWVSLSVLFFVEPGDPHYASPLELALMAPSVGAVYTVMLLWPGILVAAVVQALVFRRCPRLVEIAATAACAALALLGWSAVWSAGADAPSSLLALACGVAWALVGWVVEVVAQRRGMLGTTR